MENIQEHSLESFINLKELLSQQVNNDSKKDFLTFVKLVAPSLVSGFKMGSHIKLISNKLKGCSDPSTFQRALKVLCLQCSEFA